MEANLRTLQTLSSVPARSRRPRKPVKKPQEHASRTLVKELVRRAFATLDADSIPRRRIDALLLLATQTPLETTAKITGFSVAEVLQLEQAGQQCGIPHAVVFGCLPA